MAISDGPTPAKKPPAPVVVDSPITVGRFVKLAAFAATGGEAKQLIAAGLVTVNGQVEKRRGHTLVAGDVVEVQGVVGAVVVERVSLPGS